MLATRTRKASVKIDRIACPALVGRKEAARILGVASENLYRVDGVPRPLQDRRIKGFEVSTGPLWPRAEIEQLAKLRKADRRDAAHSRA